MDNHTTVSLRSASTYPTSHFKECGRCIQLEANHVACRKLRHMEYQHPSAHRLPNGRNLMNNPVYPLSHMHARKTASSLSIAGDEMRHMLTTSSASFTPVLLSAFNGNKPESTKTASGHHPLRNTWKDTVRRPSSAMDDMDIENNQNNPCRRTRRA